MGGGGEIGAASIARAWFFFFFLGDASEVWLGAQGDKSAGDKPSFPRPIVASDLI